ARTAGPGIRAVLWLQGCAKRCPGCITPEMLKITPRTWVDVDKLAGLLLVLDDIEGITLYGGEPLLQYRALANLFQQITAGGLSTVVYTGYLYEELCRHPDPAMQTVLAHTDILIDGPYIRELDHGEMWRGSANQRILFLSRRYREEYRWVVEAKNRDLCIHHDADGNYVILGIPPRT
ncbi:MAG: radical SAM protein, partial [Calditrichaeota bacterium]